MLKLDVSLSFFVDERQILFSFLEPHFGRAANWPLVCVKPQGNERLSQCFICWIRKFLPEHINEVNNLGDTISFAENECVHASARTEETGFY